MQQVVRSYPHSRRARAALETEHSSSINVRTGTSITELETMHVYTDSIVVVRSKETQAILVHEPQMCFNLLHAGNAQVFLALPFMLSDPCFNDYTSRASRNDNALDEYTRP